MTTGKIELVRGGLRIGGEIVPLYAGSVHYWHLDPRHWRACLESVRAMGLRLVDTYIPWGVHETAPGELDLGKRNERHDVAAFLRTAHELGLCAIVRPGPHINAELTYFGLPERIVWDKACQARSPRQNPVVLPILPKFFPVPSYASDAFHDETARYFRLLGAALGPLRYPDGPIVLVQVDNEGALYFRDGAYDQDYHPDAVAQYRAFLRQKYGTLEALQAAYGPFGDPAAGADATANANANASASAASSASSHAASDASANTNTNTSASASASGSVAHAIEDKLAQTQELRFADALPPTDLNVRDARELARHIDWAEFQEELLAHALERFGQALEAAGLGGVPTTHNMPPAQDKTPLNAARIGRAVSLVGLDYYGRASDAALSVIARRTSELAVRSEALGVPAFACEMGAGYPPYFPPLSERDSEFTLLAALAFGLRGFNVYMAVERDRWIGAPVDPRGHERPFAHFFRKLTSALERVDFARLTRPTPVRILMPRAERRLARVTHAFGPVSAALLAVLGAGAREGCREDDLGFGHAIAIEADAFAHAFEDSLDARGVPWALVSGEDRDIALQGARWVVCATSGGLNLALRERLAAARDAGARLTIGPQAPAYDGTMRAWSGADPLAGKYDLLALATPAAVDDEVARAMRELELRGHACDPDTVRATAHCDDSGRLRVLCVVNPDEKDLVARVSAPAGSYTDLLEGGTLRTEAGTLEVRLLPRSVRLLAFEA